MPDTDELPGDTPPELVAELIPEDRELLCDEFSEELVGTIPPEELLLLELLELMADTVELSGGGIISGSVCDGRGEPEPELDEELVIEDFSRNPARSHRVIGPSRLSLDRRPESPIRQEKNGDYFPLPISGCDGANSGKLGEQEFDLGAADKASIEVPVPLRTAGPCPTRTFRSRCFPQAIPARWRAQTRQIRRNPRRRPEKR